MKQLLLTQEAVKQSWMLQDGRIYLVMTIVCIILIGLFFYIASIDKKISQIEK